MLAYSHPHGSLVHLEQVQQHSFDFDAASASLESSSYKKKEQRPELFYRPLVWDFERSNRRHKSVFNERFDVGRECVTMLTRQAEFSDSKSP